MQPILSTTSSISTPLWLARLNLDIITEELQCAHIDSAMDGLFDYLSRHREEEPEEWPGFVESCRSHALCGLLHQDPFTFRAFTKPRGYAGDAVMMDYLYGLGDAGRAARDATPLGRAIFKYMDRRPASKAVRYRRRVLAELIDRVPKHGTVLSVAAGHLRELELSEAMRSGDVDEFVAFDQDESSLSVVNSDYAHLGVRTVHGSVRQILDCAAHLAQYDLVYAAGLFDYVRAPAAAALARCMFNLTRRGGLTLIANFLTGSHDAGYMEAFMDWRLIYRNHQDMTALASALPSGAVADCHLFDDHIDTITYLLVSKAK